MLVESFVDAVRVVVSRAGCGGGGGGVLLCCVVVSSIILKRDVVRSLARAW